MARIRSLKPEQPKDEALAALPIATRYLFAFLPTHADREGRLEDRPRVLKLEIFPWDDVDVESMLVELAPHFIVRYETEGRRYIQIRNFLKHQRPNNKELPSCFPDPTKEQMEERFIQKKGRLIQKEASLIQSEGIRECVGKGKGTGTGSSTHETSFVKFWDAYPKKKDKQSALRTWIKLAPDEALQAKILAAVSLQAAVPDAGLDGWKYFKHAQGWLNARRWEDEIKKGDHGNIQSGGPRGGRVVGSAAPVPGKYDHLG